MTITTPVIIILLSISVLAFVGAWLILFIKGRSLSRRGLSDDKRIVLFILLILLAVWSLRFMVGLSGKPDPSSDNIWEEIFNSLVHALQSFSLDENYTGYTLHGTDLIRESFKNAASLPFIYGLYSSVLNVVCPIAGGAVLLYIISSLLPSVKVWILSLRFWKPACYFSELNEASLALAKSIREKEAREKTRRSLLVFCDVYPDTDNESTSEQISRAKYLGAVCLHNDLDDISLRCHVKKKFFLIDENEVSNLEALTHFQEKRMLKKLYRKDEIYLFCSQADQLMIDEKMRKFFQDKLSFPPVLFSVNRHRSVVYNLLKDLPLFSGLDKDSPDKRLKLTIFGTGNVGTEMFLAATWCGQLLDYPLYITMVSNEKKNAFVSRINHINPDIFRTADPDSDLLKIYRYLPDKAPVYFHFSYLETDVYDGDMLDCLTAVQKGTENDDTWRIMDSDYFVVTLGSDRKNLEIAEKIKHYVTIDKLTDSARPEARPPIAYVVYNNDLARLLRSAAEKAAEKTDAEEETWVQMYPFGSMEETFNAGNIIIEGALAQAHANFRAYLRNSHPDNKASERGQKKAMKTEWLFKWNVAAQTASAGSLKALQEDPYKYWANVARAMHVKYKAWSLSPGMTADDYLKKAESKELDQAHRLAWLEHRRWNAFLRSSGFRAPTLAEECSYINLLPDNQKNSGKHKNLKLKLHPCIVECDETGLRKDLFDNPPAKQDLLDECSLRIKKRYKKNLNAYDFKEYDYPYYDIADDIKNTLANKTAKNQLGKFLEKLGFTRRKKDTDRKEPPAAAEKT